MWSGLLIYRVRWRNRLDIDVKKEWVVFIVKSCKAHSLIRFGLTYGFVPIVSCDNGNFQSIVQSYRTLFFPPFFQFSWENKYILVGCQLFLFLLLT